MHRGRPSAVAACIALGATALAVASCGSGGRATAAAGAAPSCLPSSLTASAQLPGTPLDVTPTPGTSHADPHTQISFVGAPAGRIKVDSVSGSHSGGHSGTLKAYSQGDGASFLPDKSFDPGEQVTVRATVAGKRVSFSFGVDTPWSTAAVGGFPNPTAPPSDSQSLATMPGVQAPVLTVTVPDHDPGAGDIFTSNGPGPGRYGALIYNPAGQLVWFDQAPKGIVAEDVSVQTFDGKRDLTFWQGKVLSLGFGQGKDYVLDSSYRTVATVSGGNGLQADLHDFQIAPHDVAYITAYNPIRCNLGPFQGSKNGVILDGTIEAIDIRTGLVRWEWHSLDHVGVSEAETSPPDAPWDWFHINSIDVQSNGDVFISARNTWAGYQIAGGTGEILWRLGGLKSSFKMGPGTKTFWQHDGRILANGDVTLFDDGSDPPEESQSRVVRIALDQKAHTARLVSSFTHPSPALLAASQGNAQTLASGNTVVGYGGVPYVSEYSKSGSLLFDAHLAPDQLFYRAYRFPWSGRPQTPPAALANLNNTAGETIVRMSWNGATGVASWRVLAGKRSGSLAAQATVGSSGFETATILPKTFVCAAKAKGCGTTQTNGYVAVQALDSGGHVIGTSRTVPVRTFAASFTSGG